MRSVIARIKLFLKEILAYTFHFLLPNSRAGIRLLIFAQGRTGSTLLEDLVCSTGYLMGGGEILGGSATKVFFPYYFISGISKYKSKRNLIYHVKIYHLTGERKKPIKPGQFLKKLQDDGWEIIYLKRNNKLRHGLSSYVAELSGAYHKYDDEKKESQFNMDSETLKLVVNFRIEQERDEVEALKNIDSLNLVYEEHLINPDLHQETVDMILKKLNLKPRPVETRLKKVNKAPLKDRILNYNELLETIKEEKWDHFLED